MSVWPSPAGLSVVVGSAPTQGFQHVRNSELCRCRVFSRFLIVSRRVSGGFRVRFVPGMCVSISLPWKSAWVVFACTSFVRIQFPLKISAFFVILPDQGMGSCGLLGSDRESGRQTGGSGQLRVPMLH